MNGIDEKELLQHYTVLKQFIDVSIKDVTKNKTGSTSANKARVKLIRLSNFQFMDLSVDVHDELKRRIDESKKEPDFLTKKTCYHSKRNHARQKLALFPQSRFNDLVMDIFYEIERRFPHLKNREEGNVIDENEKTSVSKLNAPASHMEIRSNTVAPMKAVLYWPSDGEENKEKSEVQKTKKDTKYTSYDIKILMDEISKMDKMINNFKEKADLVKDEKKGIEDKFNKLGLNYNLLLEENKKLKEEIIMLKNHVKNENHLTSNVNLDFSKEIDNLKNLNSEFSCEISCLRDVKKLSSDLKSNNNDSYNQSNSNLNESKLLIKNDITNFLNELSNFNDSSFLKNSQKYEILKKSCFNWQLKYEQSRSKTIQSDLNKNLLNNDQLKTFLSNDGLISIKQISVLHSYIESFIHYLNDDNINSTILFEKISQIVISVNEIASKGDESMTKYNEHSIILRECASHALTVTRYYAVYQKLLPKIVVERAINEITFTLCDFISFFKLFDDTNVTQLSGSNKSDIDEKKKKSTSYNNIDFFTKIKKEISNNVEHSNSSPESSKLKRLNTINYSFKENNKTPLKTNHSIQAESKSDLKRAESTCQKNNVSLTFRNSMCKEPKSLDLSDDQKKKKQFPKINTETSDKQVKSNRILNLASRFESAISKDNITNNRSYVSLISKLSISNDDLPSKSKLKHNSFNNKNNVLSKMKQLEVLDEISYSKNDKTDKTEHTQKNQNADSKLNVTSFLEKKTSPNKLKESINCLGDKFKENISDVNLGSSKTQSKSNTVFLKNLSNVFTKKDDLEYAKKNSDVTNQHNLNTPNKVNTFLQSIQNAIKNSERFVNTKKINNETKDNQSNFDFENDDPLISNSPCPKIHTKPINIAFKTSTDTNNLYTDENKKNQKEKIKVNDSKETSVHEKKDQKQKKFDKEDFDPDDFVSDNPNNTLSEVLFFLEHQTVQVIITIQSLLLTVKTPNTLKSDTLEKSKSIASVISKIIESVVSFVSQEKNNYLKEKVSSIIKKLNDCHDKLISIHEKHMDDQSMFVDKFFKQKLAAASFDIAKSIKELVGCIEDVKIKSEIAK